ncbi:hypothetical protein T4A_14062 [Trichinella pseudospiralis]|uniref:Uncharacterized protein n=1 Tax=Trichinella pseudospiralis TaxID=6337 RepID=A0A0V1EJU6_TRIPS|nr:hypothetical protein T4A_14062 [Trichinella pseudospiralis]
MKEKNALGTAIAPVLRGEKSRPIKTPSNCVKEFPSPLTNLCVFSAIAYSITNFTMSLGNANFTNLFFLTCCTLIESEKFQRD